MLVRRRIYDVCAERHQSSTSPSPNTLFRQVPLTNRLGLRITPGGEGLAILVLAGGWRRAEAERSSVAAVL